MTEENPWKPIGVRKDTKERIKKLKKRGESYDKIVNRAVDRFVEAEGKNIGTSEDGAELVINIVEEEGPVTQPELKQRLSEEQEVRPKTVTHWVREATKEGKIRQYYCDMRAGSGSIKYRDSDVFNPEYHRKNILFVDENRFLEFLREKVLRLDMGEISTREKGILTHHFRNKFSEEFIEKLQREYLKKYDRDE